MSDERTRCKVEQVADGVTYAEAPIDYTDGYRVTVGWSADDDAWLARISGLSTGDVMGDGQSRESALLSLCCALALRVEAVNEP